MINRIKKYTSNPKDKIQIMSNPMGTSNWYKTRGKGIDQPLLLDSFRKIIVDQAGTIAELEEKLQAKNDRMKRMIIKVRKLIAQAEKMKGKALDGKKE